MRSAWTACAALLARGALPLAVSCLVACGDDDSSSAGGAAPPDSGPEAGSTLDGTVDEVPPDGGAEADAAEADDDGGLACADDDDCDDALYCNGRERCVDGLCKVGVPPPCTAVHICDEVNDRCECGDPDHDKDGVKAKECGFPDGDCDDGNGSVYPGNTERCDREGIDHDCNPLTYRDPNDPSDADDDGDTFTGQWCFNVDEHGVVHGGTDCDDTAPTIYEGAPEICNYKDDDCDSKLDEGPSADDPDLIEPLALRGTFYPDFDRDNAINHDAEPVRACAPAPTGYLDDSHPDDCDDYNPKRNNSADEMCDAVDNDCDGLIDAADNDLVKEYDQADTDFACEEGRWTIKDCPNGRAWCMRDIVDRGCETDATTLVNCGECGVRCDFACAGRPRGCDEITALALGEEHSCAITEHGTVGCWGYGFEGRLGLGDTLSRATPTELFRATEASALASGPTVSCAVLGSSKVAHCWGSNVDGLLATPDLSLTFSTVPLAVSGYYEPLLEQTERIAVSSRHACAIRTGGELFCWGSEENGRLASDWASTDIYDFPLSALREGGLPVDDAEELALGVAHGCMINTARGLECWGDNSEGQLGDVDFVEPYSDVVRAVPGLANVAALTVGAAHSCVIIEGDVLCWGLNSSGQLGRVSDPDDGTPQVVDGIDGALAVAAGSSFTCAIDASHDIWCWGSNGQGQRGDADPEDSAVPTRVAVELPATALAAGEAHACAITAEGAMCWGANALGQLGRGQASYDPSIIPQVIKSLIRTHQ